MTIESHEREPFNLWKAFVKIQNPLMTWMLKSPMHWIVSHWYMLISVTGRKTGQIYTTPVQYKAQDGKVYVISNKSYRWWRNLRDGARVTLVLRGKVVEGEAIVSTGLGDVLATFDILYPGMKQEQRDSLADDCVAICITL